MRSLATVAIFLACSTAALAVSPVPRKSPEFTIVEPSGKRTLLSSFKGQVVVIEFVLTNCPHCQRVSQTIAKLYQKFGPRGFQPVGIAFDLGVSGPKVRDFIQQFEITYPVGHSTSEAVDSYLGRSAMELLMVPQLVVIDRQGVIRAQSSHNGDPNLEDESYLRNLIGSLLQEGR